jgi:outer membrane protein TolC
MKKTAFFFLVFPLALTAQNSLLTENDALKTGLKNNFNIIVAANDAAADSIRNSAGEAGMLPSVTLNGSLGFNQNNIHQKYANGNEFISPNAGTNSLASSVALSWTLFDGTKMFVTKEKLGLVQTQGEYQFRSEVLNTSATILNAYYDVVRQQLKLKSIDEVTKANEERLKITESRYTSGLGPKTEVNQAKIDLNQQKENKMLQEEALAEAKRKLNNLMARDVNIPFDVVNEFPEGPLPDRQLLEQKMYASNPDLLAFKSQVEISKLTLRENKTQYFPRLTAQAGYNFNRAENTAGFSLYNQSYGWNTGLTLSVPLYQAGKTKRSVAISTMELATAETQFAKASLGASLELQNGLSAWDAKSKMIALEKENVALARENMELSLERLRLGSGTAFEVQQAQISLSSSLSRLTDLQYELKSEDIGIHRLAADI